jgi:SAM-dependent methyltransferase
VNSSPRRRAGVSDASDSAYALGRSSVETERLQRQADELEPESVALLDRVDRPVGGSAIDLGCGPAGVLALLAERVGVRGRVVGLDSDPTHVSLARAFARERGLAQVEIVEADASQTGLPANSFDLVHARTLLINLPDPAAVVAEMVRLAKPGGHVLVQEPDLAVRICYPLDPAWTELAELFLAVAQRNGADLYIGRRLPTLLRRAGLVDIGIEARAAIYPHGHTRRAVLADLMRSLRPIIVDQGLRTEAELEDLDRAVRSHLDNPDVLVLPGLSFLAWSRKPADSLEAHTDLHRL